MVNHKYRFNPDDPTASVTKMVQNLGWKELRERRCEARLVLFYKIAIPINSYLTLAPNRYRSRHAHTYTYSIPYTRTDI